VTDRIELRALRLLGRHGALPGERDRAQPFEVDLDVEANVSIPGRADDLGLAVDYGSIVQAAAAVVTDTSVALLETLAEQIADAVLAQPGVDGVTVTIRKLRPPVPFDLASAGVRIERRARS
jgi:dihydroneopterin aldolase